MMNLEGTEKQVKWAEDIRKKFLENIEIINPESSKFDLRASVKIRHMLIEERGYEEYKLSQDERERKDKDAMLSKTRKMYEDILEKITSEKEAEWFIKSRFYTNWSSIPFYLPSKSSNL